MKRKVKIIVADPAGNITIFVKDRFERSMYPPVAAQLLAMEDLKGEQVAFILDAPSCGRAEGKMEMCGLEFCGNASRSFGLIRAKEMGVKGSGSVNVDVSGCDEILTVEVDTEKNYTKIKMPNPVSMSKIDLSALAIDDGCSGESADMCGDIKNDGRDAAEQLSCAPIVDFGGIIHVILSGVAATEKNFNTVKDFIMKKYNPPAMGVMFCGERTREGGDVCPITPVVYVKDVDTTYFEGSCGSGTTACAAALAAEMGDGAHHFVFPQPAGTIESTAHINGGNVEKIFIEGAVGLSEEMEVEIEIEI